MSEFMLHVGIAVILCGLSTFQIKDDRKEVKAMAFISWIIAGLLLIEGIYQLIQGR